MGQDKKVERELDATKALYFRDRLRSARYKALADSEGFSQMCYVIEELGSYLFPRGGGLGGYKPKIRGLLQANMQFLNITKTFPELFSSFDNLYETLRLARNDAMHTGVYARHATTAGVELCLIIEDALVAKFARTKVQDFVVRDPVAVECWQPVAYARRLMLEHSFSYLPIFIDGKWKLISEMAVAKYFFRYEKNERQQGLGKLISEAVQADSPLSLIEATVVELNTDIQDVLENAGNSHTLWVVANNDRLIGVLSPFELM